MARIIVRASPEEFVFAGERASVSVAPVVWHGPQGRIAAFGTEHAHAIPADHTRIDLFPPDRPVGHAESVLVPLQLFLRYHFVCVLQPPGTPWWRKLVAVRPHVVFAEVRGFDERVDGDLRSLLGRASRGAGAGRVEFDASFVRPRRRSRVA